MEVINFAPAPKRNDEITLSFIYVGTVVPTESDSGVILCLQLLSKT